MRNFILGFALALSVSATALTRHADGSMTFTAEEVAALERNIGGMVGDLNTAVAIIGRLQQDLDAVKKAKCI
jgi:DNA-binding transcriptional regulator YdaS (Cro superfamily)